MKFLAFLDKIILHRESDKKDSPDDYTEKNIRQDKTVNTSLKP